MADIIKTWPACIPAKTTARIFSQRKWPFSEMYFSLGRGKPKQKLGCMWFNYQGRILCFFEVKKVVCNDGSLQKLRRLDGGESGWQFTKGAWVAVCVPPCYRIRDRIFMEGFRGWRYFDIDAYRKTSESRHRL